MAPDEAGEMQMRLASGKAKYKKLLQWEGTRMRDITIKLGHELVRMRMSE
jgi:hypothetical protein